MLELVCKILEKLMSIDMQCNNCSRNKKKCWREFDPDDVEYSFDFSHESQRLKKRLYV